MSPKYHDERGKFKPGNPGGGRKAGSKRAKLIDIMRSEVSAADWRQIVRNAKFEAMNGDTSARKWLSDYLLGVPAQRVELTGEDGGPLVLNLTWGDDAPDDGYSPETA